MSRLSPLKLLFALFLLIPFQGSVLSGTPQHPRYGSTVQQYPFQSDCARCHGPGKRLVTDVSRPECAECHLPGAARAGGLLQIAKRSSQAPGPLKSAPIHSNRLEGRPSTSALPDTKAEKIIEQKMIRIPAGSFIMGNDGRPTTEGPGDLDETPKHRASTGAYYIDKYEVTNAHYKRFVDATGHPPPIHWRNGTYPPGKANHPVVYVSWYDAKTFCEWNGKRLPTEAEWEKAARGTDGRHFPWGNRFDPKRANTPQYWLSRGLKPEDGDTMPVGSFENGKSPFGLYDMAGNVYEWVENWYKPYPGNQYPNPFYGERDKILRGGSWYDCLSYGCGLSAPSYNRSRFTPEIRNSGFGFRCAKSIK
ncbi:MAG TPA: formylglycine-generating enzyme family protein [Nitrospiria bacterium]|nr:formylglycine-generating enzyme family protein [Nitrospiria bacterium]